MEGLGLGAVRVHRWGGSDGAGHRRSLGGSVHSGCGYGGFKASLVSGGG